MGGATALILCLVGAAILTDILLRLVATRWIAEPKNAGGFPARPAGWFWLICFIGLICAMVTLGWIIFACFMFYFMKFGR